MLQPVELRELGQETDTREQTVLHEGGFNGQHLARSRRFAPFHTPLEVKKAKQPYSCFSFHVFLPRPWAKCLVPSEGK